MMVEPSQGNTPGTQPPDPVSTKQRRIAKLAQPSSCDLALGVVRLARGSGTPPSSEGVSERICPVKNRMREIRTSGSVRGEGGNLLAYSTSASGRNGRKFRSDKGLYEKWVTCASEETKAIVAGAQVRSISSGVPHRRGRRCHIRGRCERGPARQTQPICPRPFARAGFCGIGSCHERAGPLRWSPVSRGNTVYGSR